MELTWLVGVGRWSGVIGGRSKVATAGSQGRQEWGEAGSPGLRGGAVWRYEAREAGAESLLQHTILLGRMVQAVQAHWEEENLQCPYVPPSCDWCVPH